MGEVRIPVKTITENGKQYFTVVFYKRTGINKKDLFLKVS